MPQDNPTAEKNSATAKSLPVPPNGILPPGRMADRGPRYTETPADPFSSDAPTVAEPWNTLTASFFIVIASVWLYRLRGRFVRFPMLTGCLMILLTGGIGGTLYHAHRTRTLYFLLDVIPIQLLGTAAMLYLVIRLGRTEGVKKVAVVTLGILGAFVFMNGVVFRNQDLAARYPNLPINLSYASLAIVILVPVVVVLLRTRGRHGGWIATALASFAVGWIFRLIDPIFDRESTLPMGTHWLWHTFGAIATAALISYFYRIEGRTFEELAGRKSVTRNVPAM